MYLYFNFRNKCVTLGYLTKVLIHLNSQFLYNMTKQPFEKHGGKAMDRK